MFRTIGRDNLLVMISLLVWALGEGLWLNLRQILLGQLGATPEQIGLSGWIESLGRLLLLIPIGYLIDRYGPRVFIIAGWAMGIVCAPLMALAPTWQLLTAGLTLYATTNFVIPAFSAYVLVAAPPGVDPQRTLSFIYASFPIGLLISPALGGLIAAQLGSIRSLFWIAMGMYAISTAILVATRHVKPHPRTEKFHFHHLLHNKAFVGYSVFFAAALFAMIISQWMISKFMESARHLDVATIGALFSVLALGTITFNLITGRLGRRWAFPLVMGVMWVASVVLWLVSDLPGIAVGCFMMGVIYCIRPAVLARLELVVQPEDRGMAFSVVEILFGLSTGLAALLAGQLFALTPGHDLPLVASVVTIPIIAAIWFGMRLGRLPQASPGVVPLAAGEQ